MATVINFSVCQTDCNTLIFKDLTGAYDATTNPTGYGTPNLVLADVTTCVLSVTSPSGTTYTIDLIPTYPTVDTDLEFEITNTVLTNSNSSAAIEDGLWVFEYKMYDAVNFLYYKKTIEKVFTCQVECCVKKMFTKVATATACNGCQEEYLSKALIAWGLLKTIKANAGCGNSSVIASTLKTLNNMCNNNNCGCS